MREYNKYGRKHIIGGELSFVKFKLTSEHFLSKYQSIGMSKPALLELQEDGITKIFMNYFGDEGDNKLPGTLRGHHIFMGTVQQFLDEGMDWLDTSNGFEDEQKHIHVLHMKLIRTYNQDALDMLS